MRLRQSAPRQHFRAQVHLLSADVPPIPKGPQPPPEAGPIRPPRPRCKIARTASPSPFSISVRTLVLLKRIPRRGGPASLQHGLIPATRLQHGCTRLCCRRTGPAHLRRRRVLSCTRLSASLARAAPGKRPGPPPSRRIVRVAAGPGPVPPPALPGPVRAGLRRSDTCRRRRLGRHLDGPGRCVPVGPGPGPATGWPQAEGCLCLRF